MLGAVLEDLDHVGLPDQLAVSAGDGMRVSILLPIAALAGAVACGGGGGGGGGSVVTPTLSAGFVADQPSPGPNTVAMAQGTKANDVITVNVDITDTSNVFGAAFEVVYDSVHATYLGYSAGSALEAGGNTPVYTVSNASTGRVVVGAARTGGTTTNVSGTVPLIRLQFQVKASGSFPVTVQNSSLYDNQQPTPQSLAGISWFAGALTGV